MYFIFCHSIIYLNLRNRRVRRELETLQPLYGIAFLYDIVQKLIFAFRNPSINLLYRKSVFKKTLFKINLIFHDCK